MAIQRKCAFAAVAVFAVLFGAAWASTLAESTPEMFQLQVTTAAANQTFRIPTSGILGGSSSNKHYNWNIDWGDGSTENSSGTQTNAGIPHTYTTVGTYTITIKPAGSTSAWLSAFGMYIGTTDANASANKNMVTAVIGPLTPLMTRTQAQIDDPVNNPPPTYEWAYTFNGCINLTMGVNFKFADEWNNINAVGDYFAYSMFSGCSGSAFTMSPVFNMPQGIIRVGDYFAYCMFYNCSGSAFTMSPVFNMPQGIIRVGDYFAYSMFYDCRGNTFTMSPVFNMPQGITSVGVHFASSMFYNCRGSAFTMSPVFNMPQGIISVGDNFADCMFHSCYGSAFTMNPMFNLPSEITNGGHRFAALMFTLCRGNAFTMNPVFNLPQGITSVDGSFAASMFYSCYGSAFTINEVFKFPALAQTEVNKNSVFHGTFYGLRDDVVQPRTAMSIINGNPVPNSNRFTFSHESGTARFSDLNSIAPEWGGQTRATIKINTQPAIEINVDFGSISSNLLVAATATQNAFLSYQWYRNTVASNMGGTQISGANASTFAIPTTLAVGTYYYYCVVSAIGAANDAVSNVAKVIVSPLPTYTVTFVDWDDAVLKTQPGVTHGSAATPPTNPTRTGYTFGGWYKETECINAWVFDTDIVISDTTLYAKWRPVFTVTFNSHSGSDVPPQKITSGDKVTIPINPTRTGHTFGGWYNDEVYTGAWDFDNYVVMSDTTLYAKWTSNNYTVTYYLNDGTQESGALDNYTYGVGLTLPISPTRIGYTFNGWHDNADLTGTAVTAISTTAIDDKEFWAKWTPNNYTVTYNGNDNTGGVAPTVQTSAYNTTVTVAGVGSLVKIGHELVSWNTVADGSGTDYTVGAAYSIPAGNTTLYAQWAVNNYTVTYNGNGSTGGVAPTVQTSAYNTTVSVSGVGTLVKTGHSFTGWNTAADGSGTDYTVEAAYIIPASNTTLYAQWAQIPVTDISGIPSLIAVGTHVTLNGTVVPANALKQAIEWRIVSAGSTGSVLSAGMLIATMEGILVLEATVIGGNADGTDYVKPFVITVSKMTSIASYDRNIPVTPDKDAAVIAPVNVSAFELTVGPNPVRKSDDGVVKIFVIGKRVDGGTLAVYDATGNVVRKINICDNAVIGNVGRRVVGSWDLKDGKGNAVSEGTYLLRGVVKTVDGRRERVSVVVGVR